jgi:hypothetical protein
MNKYIVREFANGNTHVRKVNPKGIDEGEHPKSHTTVVDAEDEAEAITKGKLKIADKKDKEKNKIV